jgi:hypothetical protein
LEDGINLDPLNQMILLGPWNPLKNLKRVRDLTLAEQQQLHALAESMAREALGPDWNKRQISSGQRKPELGSAKYRGKNAANNSEFWPRR